MATVNYKDIGAESSRKESSRPENDEEDFFSSIAQLKINNLENDKKATMRSWRKASSARLHV